MSKDKELQVVRRLTLGTQQGKINWERVADPKCYRFVGRLPTGKTFELVAPHPEGFPPDAADTLIGRAALEVRDEEDRLVTTIDARRPMPPLLPADPRVGALLELLSVVRSKVEEPLGETLAELEHLSSA